jgi:phosphoribosylformylglycinamidine synthase
MRIKGTGNKETGNREQGSENRERGLAMALDGNGRWAYLDPKLGAMHAVAEAARKVACTGAMPVAATNCLNFGNPEKPEIMAQLSAAIDGIAEACTALGAPITGGNVSLYNETRGEGIYPTPVLGIVGILDDVTKAVPAAFQRSGDAILLLWPVPRAEAPNPNLEVPFQPIPINPYIVPAMSLDPAFPVAEPLAAPVSDAEQDTVETPAEELAAFGSSEFAKAVLGKLWGKPPDLDLDAEADLHTLLRGLADRKLIHSARDISDGGIAAGLAQAAFAHGVGAKVEQEQSLMEHPLFGLFAEPSSTVILTTAEDHIGAIEKLAGEYNFFVARIGTTGGDRLEISVDHQPLVSASLTDLRKPWATSLEAALHDEVIA